MTARYVAGFVFDLRDYEVVLVRKARPEWQAGKLNGVGGKIEYGEGKWDAMVREFEEETGVFIDKPYWKHFLRLSGEDWEVEFFTSKMANIASKVKTMEDEEILTVPVSKLSTHNVIPNLLWLVPLALQASEYQLVKVEEK